MSSRIGVRILLGHEVFHCSQDILSDFEVSSKVTESLVRHQVSNSGFSFNGQQIVRQLASRF